MLSEYLGPIHYRYEIQEIEGVWEFGLKVKIRLESYEVVAETPKGYWLTYGGYSKDFWVSKDSRKRWAFPSKKEALVSFLKRKKRYVQILKHQLLKTEMAIPLAKEMLDGL